MRQSLPPYKKMFCLVLVDCRVSFHGGSAKWDLCRVLTQKKNTPHRWRGRNKIRMTCGPYFHLIVNSYICLHVSSDMWVPLVRFRVKKGEKSWLDAEAVLICKIKIRYPSPNYSRVLVLCNYLSISLVAHAD